MRKMKKINGYLVVRFNDREKREHEGTALGNFGVIDAELYTGVLDIDWSIMEYDDAETLEIAMEQARGLESELDVEEPESKITVIVEGETEISEGVHALHDAIPEDAVKLLMEGRRRSDEVVREIGPPEVAEVDRPELPAQSPGPGELRPGVEVLEELRPELREVLPPLDVLLK